MRHRILADSLRLDLRTFLLTLLALLVAPVTAAQVPGGSVVPYVGYDYTTKHHLVGVGARLDLPVPGRFSVQPSVEGQFTGDDFVTRHLQGNLDLVAEVPVSIVTPYVGAGLAVVYRHTEPFGGDSRLGGNLFAGVALGPTSGPRPFAQLGYSATDILEDSAVTLTGGVVIGL